MNARNPHLERHGAVDDDVPRDEIVASGELPPPWDADVNPVGALGIEGSVSCCVQVAETNARKVRSNGFQSRATNAWNARSRSCGGIRGKRSSTLRKV